MWRPLQVARERFNAYASMDAPHLPADPMSAAQVGVARAAGAVDPLHLVAAAASALGEVAHQVILAKLLASRLPPPMEDLEVNLAAALRDLVTVCMNLATSFRLDLGALIVASNHPQG